MSIRLKDECAFKDVQQLRTGVKVSSQRSTGNELCPIHHDLASLGTLQILLLKGGSGHGRRRFEAALGAFFWVAFDLPIF